jgi:pSer/pThr/pTyr-binding forkhead associated (FHA) protein
VIELFVLTGSDVGRSFQVRPGAQLGRDSSCEIRLRDRSVSRTHARLERDDSGCWWIVDAGSRNGVFVAGERVQRAPLADQTEFQLGELCLRVRIDGSPGTKTAAQSAAVEQGPAGLPRQEGPGEEIELEPPEEIELAPFSAARASEAPAARRGDRIGETTLVRPASEAVPPHPGARRVRIEEHRGWLATDMSQLVFWQRFLVYAFAVLGAALLGYLAWRATSLLRLQARSAAGASAVELESGG